MNQANIQETTIINGFIGFSENWDFMNQEAPFVLPKKIIVESVNKDTFGGMASMNGIEKMMQVSLGEYPTHSLLQVVLVTKPNRILLPNVKKALVASVDEALESLQGRETMVSWPSPCCDTFAKVLECRKCCANDSIAVATADVQTFGMVFNACFRRRMQAIEPGCRTFTVTTDSEQYSANEFATTVVRSYNLNRFAELSVRFGRIYQQSDCALFWEKNTLTQFMRRLPDIEYYPGLLNRLGEFEYKLQQQNETKIQVVGALFSTELFEAERRKSKLDLFNTPFFGEFIAGSKNCEYIRDELTEITWLERMETILENYIQKPQLVAKCEAILTALDPGSETLQQMRMKFDETFRPEAKKLLYSYNMDMIRTHLYETMRPPLNTLEPLLHEKIDSLDVRELYVPSLENIKLASLCEAIISFGIYGKGIYHGEKGDQLLCDFGLQAFNFNKNQPLFGLATLQNVGVVSGKVVINDYSSVSLYVSNVFFNVDNENQINVEKLLVSMTGKTRVRKYCKRLARVFWVSLKKFIIDTHSSEDEPLCTLESIAASISQRNTIRPMSANELIQYLNSEDVPYMKIYTQFFKILEYCMSNDHWDEFLEACRVVIEKKLYESGTALVFPVRCNSLFDIVVLPIRKVDSFSFTVMPDADRENLFKHFQTVYDKVYGNDEPFPNLHQYLIQYQNDIGSNDVTMTEALGFLFEKIVAENEANDDNQQNFVDDIEMEEGDGVAGDQVPFDNGGFEANLDGLDDNVGQENVDQIVRDDERFVVDLENEQDFDAVDDEYVQVDIIQQAELVVNVAESGGESDSDNEQGLLDLEPLDFPLRNVRP